MGINSELLSKIFDPFFTTKKSGKGTGLGLAMVYSTIVGHGGSIEVKSATKQGTEVCIYLRLQKYSEKETIILTNISSENPSILKPCSILFVDDDYEIRSISKAILENHGCKIATCADGKEGLEYYRENFKNIDIVVLDMVMPVMDGLEAYIEMKKVNPKIKVVICSGYGEDHSFTEIKNRGAEAFIQKPFTMNALSRKIRGILDAA